MLEVPADCLELVLGACVHCSSQQVAFTPQGGDFRFSAHMEQPPVRRPLAAPGDRAGGPTARPLNPAAQALLRAVRRLLSSRHQTIVELKQWVSDTAPLDGGDILKLLDEVVEILPHTTDEEPGSQDDGAQHMQE